MQPYLTTASVLAFLLAGCSSAEQRAIISAPASVRVELTKSGTTGLRGPNLFDPGRDLRSADAVQEAKLSPADREREKEVSKECTGDERSFAVDAIVGFAVKELVSFLVDAIDRALQKELKKYTQAFAGHATVRFRSYGAAMKVIGNAAHQTCGRWLNNQAENSHQPFRRREGSMAKFRDIKTLQKSAAVHTSIHNHFNLDRHLNRRDIFKRNRSAALAEWRLLAA